MIKIADQKYKSIPACAVGTLSTPESADGDLGGLQI